MRRHCLGHVRRKSQDCVLSCDEEKATVKGGERERNFKKVAVTRPGLQEGNDCRSQISPCDFLYSNIQNIGKELPTNVNTKKADQAVADRKLALKQVYR